MTSTNPKPPSRSNRIKFIAGGVLLLAAVVFMVISTTQNTAQFFMTVNELRHSDRDLMGENLRVSGAVIGDSILYDTTSGALHFMIANIPGDDKQIEAQGGLEVVLHQAVLNPDEPRLEVVYHGAPPDMLKDEAQAIMTGTMQSDGTFLAEEILLKCPSKYEEALPEQVVTAQP
jgi:cytochrome c-type biogenesis protein CcmE